VKLWWCLVWCQFFWSERSDHSTVPNGLLCNNVLCFNNDLTQTSVRDSRPDTAPQERPHLSHLINKKNKNPHFLICLLAWRPLPYAYPPDDRSSVAAHPFAPSPRCARLAVSCPSPHRRPRARALAPCAAHLRPSHLRRSLPRRPSLAHRRRCAVDPAMATGAHVPRRLRSSLIEPREPTSVPGVGGARTAARR
jgi:hypothetical protein